MSDVIMPQVGQDIPTAVIVTWHKQVGDVVARGEVVAEVESDKATFEVEADAAGTLTEILYESGSEVEVFKPIARIGDGSSVSETAAASGAPSSTEHHGADASPAASVVGPAAAEKVEVDEPAGCDAGGGKRILASPLARRIAREQKVDLATLSGSGPHGRIKKRDVLAAASATASVGSPSVAAADMFKPEPADRTDDDEVIPFTRMCRRIADRLTLSKQTIPHFYLFADIDMTGALAWRKQFNADAPQTVTINDLVLKATAAALAGEPALNAHVESDKVIRKSRVNLGVATSVDQGLVVPVIADADRLNLVGLAMAVRQVSEDARQGRLNLDHVGTFTVSSLGMFGVSGFVPVINPPQCAILAVGAVEPRVVPVETDTGLAMGIRQMMSVTLAADHRAVDGVDAARFLKMLRTTLESLGEAAPGWV